MYRCQLSVLHALFAIILFQSLIRFFQFCLGMMQRLITQQAVDTKGARYITDSLWMLMESGTEEVKILQSVTLLLTSNMIVHGETLARVIDNQF